MHNLRRFYYQNKYKIWGVILFIVLILVGIQVLNKIVAMSNNKKINEALSNNSNNQNTIINNKDNNSYLTSDTSGVTGEKVSNTSLEKAKETIGDFITACNNGNIEEAYNYLSADCKEELYIDINSFRRLYYDTIFEGEKKTASVENWISSTYKVNISGDILATGNVNGMKTQDYMTIVKEDGESKLNINSFVKREKLNKEQSIDNIKFTILAKNVYMDYEEYKIEVQNQTGARMLLDTQENTKSIYVEDNSEVKYYSYSHEIPSQQLKINNGFSTQLNIKFSKSYSIDRETKSIVFSNVVLNYDDTINEDTEKKMIKINI